MVEEMELLIGGSRIDKQYYEWLDLWYELARDVSHERGYDNKSSHKEDGCKLCI